MRTDDFDFHLPEELIALEPPAIRSSARLLSVGAALTDQTVAALPRILRRNDLLVVNDTKVIPAALEGFRAPRDGGTGKGVRVEANLIQRREPVGGRALWTAFARPAKRLKVGDLLTFRKLTAEVVRRDGMETDLLFHVSHNDFDAALADAGMPPLPPYIARKRPVRDDDRERYQTVYAQEAGSVAAPTAGLHFTDELFTELEQAGIGRAQVTLHVGAGTFLPVTEDDPSDHKMHAEWCQISPSVAERINETRTAGGRIVAVGTTSLRLLETAWKDGEIHAFSGETSIFLKPGDPFPSADLLLTNFHLPRSTLFMLVCGFAGTERMKAAYAHAIKERYRFYSYGDACLLHHHAMAAP
ncbi:MAG: tRNA preQ1(34) S-adenosylmethionine ribosyltransferase-isomerase QueA [Pseudomonadota bacterium]